MNFGSAASGGQAINPAAYANINPSAYGGPSESSGYTGPQASPLYSGFAGYQAQSYGSSGAGPAGYGSENAFGGSSGLYNTQTNADGSARKPEEAQAQILPAGFSYHGTEGQSFLRQRDSPNFLVSDEHEDSARGPVQKGFLNNFEVTGPSSSGRVLRNGLVGYGPGGPRGGSLPVGGYAGPQFAGLVREHGGHTEQDVTSYSG